MNVIERAEKPQTDSLMLALAVYLDSNYMKDKQEKFVDTMKSLSKSLSDHTPDEASKKSKTPKGSKGA